MFFSCKHFSVQVILTTLSDKTCKRIGYAKKDNLGGALAVNTRIELCGAFINTMEVGLVNYTVNQDTEKTKQKKKVAPDNFEFSELDPKKIKGKKSKSLLRYIILKSGLYPI